MSYFLLVSILIAAIAIIYVWYASRGLNSISDDVILALDTDEDKILSQWYQTQIKPTFDFQTNDTEVAVKYLKRLYDLDVDPNSIVVGSSLNAQYRKLTQRRLATQYTAGADCLFDLRSTIGIPGEIAVVMDPRIRTTLFRNNTTDASMFTAIINNELDITARDYLHELLNQRWERIRQLNDPNVINSGGSYLYLNITRETVSGSTSVLVFDNVTGLITEDGARINLLCSNLEFETLIARWKKSLSNIEVIAAV